MLESVSRHRENPRCHYSTGAFRFRNAPILVGMLLHNRLWLWSGCRKIRREPFRARLFRRTSNARRPAINRGAGYRPDSRSLQNARLVPTAFRPDHDIRIDTEGDRLRMRSSVENDLYIVEVGERKLFAAFKRSKSKAIEEVQQPLLCMCVNAAVSLCPAEFDGGLRDLERNACFSKFTPHCEAFDFRKIGKVANSQTRGGLITNVADEARCRKITAAQFLAGRTYLLSNIHRTADRHDAHHIVKCARDSHCFSSRFCSRVVIIVNGHLRCFLVLTAINMNRCALDSIVSGTWLKSHGLHQFQAVRRSRTSVHVDIAVEPRGDFLDSQRHPACNDA